MTETTPDTYLDVFEQLEHSGSRYVVVGGVAVVLRGYARPIADLDVVVDPDPTTANLAVRALMKLGFAPTIPLPLSAVPLLRMFDASQREVDVFRRYHIPFEELWIASEELSVSTGSARVASLDHLLRVKKLIGRAEDASDVKGLLSLETSGDA